MAKEGKVVCEKDIVRAINFQPLIIIIIFFLGSFG